MCECTAFDTSRVHKFEKTARVYRGYNKLGQKEGKPEKFYSVFGCIVSTDTGIFAGTCYMRGLLINCYINYCIYWFN